MFRAKEPILVFGAGAGAARAIAILRHRCRVVAFLDNNPAKHGQTFMGRPIVAPATLPSYPTERIYIASMYADQIYRQLTIELGIAPSRIEIVRKPVLEGAYEVSPRTYVVLGALAALALVLVGGLGYFIRAALDR